MKKLTILLTILVLVGVVGFAEGKEIIYSGRSEYDGLKVQTYFIFNDETSVIKKFQTKAKCEGTFAFDWSVDNIYVKKDGSFYYEKDNNWIKGKDIIPSKNKTASGMLGGVIFSIAKPCGKENPEWSAEVEKASMPSVSTSLNLAGDWEGTANWPGIISTITFNIPENMREVKDLKIIFACAKGVSKIQATPTVAIILKDNRFDFVAGQGSRGTATFVSEDSVEGSYTAPISIGCDEGFLKIEGKWTAHKKKK